MKIDLEFHGNIFTFWLDFFKLLIKANYAIGNPLKRYENVKIWTIELYIEQLILKTNTRRQSSLLVDLKAGASKEGQK